jgi:snRNA-activating protein complex (SNAPc), subunit 3
VNGFFYIYHYFKVNIVKVIEFDETFHQFDANDFRHYQDWMATTLSVDAGIEHMDERPLMDIEMSLGTPYLYKHGPAGCEHFVVFSDVRFLHADDELDLSLYPRTIFEASAKWPVCTICGGMSK